MDRVLHSSANATLYEDGFETAFPYSLRSEKRALPCFYEHVPLQ